MAVKQSTQESIYDDKRYWYHVSNTLTRKQHKLIPWNNSQGMNRSDDEPDGKRICVAPSVAHCLTAVPYCLSEFYVVYRTKEPIKAHKAHGVFDAEITQEGWIKRPTVFVKIGTLDLDDVEIGEGISHVIKEAASKGKPSYSHKVLRWWLKINPEKYIKQPLTRKKKAV